MQTIDTSRLNKHRILFLTGTRADYGKIKSLIRLLANNNLFDIHIFATGMHMLAKYGSTYKEIIKDGFSNVYTFVNQNTNTDMDIALSNTITGFSNYVAELQPDAIIVHGDRLEALAGAIVGAFRNIRVFHIEGGEISGTIDESIRHAITKFSHFHFVANEAAKKRILQLGEPEDHIFIIGSPDIDIMYSNTLPNLTDVRMYYEIPFTNYNIVLYHPVTTRLSQIARATQHVVNTILATHDNYVIIYPNNDAGSDLILEEYNALSNLPNIKIYPSMRFEYFLTLLKNASLIIGNSSSGIREAGIYGIPAIDLGDRQRGRYSTSDSPHIIHVQEKDFTPQTIIDAQNINPSPISNFGEGKSDILFQEILSSNDIWDADIQKKFIDINF